MTMEVLYALQQIQSLLLIETQEKHKNQIAINYCPICGRKLVKEYEDK